MTLNDCTKAELIFVIERLQLWNQSQTHFVQCALNDVEEQRDKKKLEEAEKLSAYACKRRQEYIDLLAPYEGKRLIDIPDSVIKKADAAMKEAQKADSKWNKIMGLGLENLGVEKP